ncbi:uncharacterized protein [Nicotiana sylvestris]|uniref:uncharacterized protein n=1 Tax=Nicotiana sylvestris TaxID=4096 RepID=UPI00388C3A7E
MGKTTEEALQLLNEISENVIQWPSEHVIIMKAATVNQVNVIGYKQYPFGSPMAQKYPGFQWSNPNGTENYQSFQKQQVRGPPGYQNQNRGQTNFRPYQQAAPYQQRLQQTHSDLDDLLYKYIKATDEKMESHNSALKNLEVQLSQLATLVSEKIQGPLPSNTEKNSKEHLKDITLRSGKNLEEPYADTKGKNQEDQQILKQIHINIPFTVVLLQMPSYAKILKEILSSKRKLEEVSVVMLTKKCSAILQNKLPQKLGDPGSFTISCTLGGVYFEKALCDCGASINLMPFSIFRRLDLGEMKDIGVSFQFADQRRAIIDVHQGQLILRVDKERVIFDMQKMLRFSGDKTSSSCFSIDIISNITYEFKDDYLISDSMERCLAKSDTTHDDDPTIRREAEILEKYSEEEEIQLEVVQPKIKLKVLPSYLKYGYLEQELFPVIISSSLTAKQEEKLIEVLKAHKGALE